MIWSSIRDDKVNGNYVEEFAIGTYDEYLSHLFSQFDIKYNPKRKTDYFNIFFLVMFKTRWVNYGNATRIKRFRKYQMLIDKLNRANNK